MKKYICPCCGGHINQLKLQCEYCGTQFEDENNPLLRVETFTSPVDTLCCNVLVAQEDIEKSKEIVCQQIAHDIAKRISKNYTQYDIEYDPQTQYYTVRAVIKVIKPINNKWYINEV